MQVESEANQYIPFALEEVNLDFQVLGPAPSATGGSQEVLIAASRKEKVEDRVAVAESAGLKALVMDVESYRAADRASSWSPAAAERAASDQNVAVVDVGANVMNITVLRNDQSVYTREQAFGGNQLTQDIVQPLRHDVREEAENAKRSGGLPDELRGRGAAAVHGEPVDGDPARDAVLLHLDPVQRGRPHPARRRHSTVIPGSRNGEHAHAA